MSGLATYLERCGKRLRARFIARSAAAITLSVAALTVLFAFLFVTFVPGTGWVLALRILLYVALIAAIGLTWWRPFRGADVASSVEQRGAGFDGRLRTWRDASEREDHSPLLALLTRETERLAHSQPAKQIVPSKEIAMPFALAAVIVTAVIAFVSSGTSPWQLAGQRLWSGDLFTSAAPRITVNPGDVVVPRGADVVVEAIASGFVPRNMALHAAFEQSDGWETAPMSRLGGAGVTEKYGFIFVGLTEQVSYYVGAQGINSERHVIHVADLPKVTGVNLTYVYPDWTGRTADERDNGDVAALAGTEVRIDATTDVAVQDPLIVVNGEVIPAHAQGFVSSADFEVTEPGSWHVAVRHEGTLARISDTYLIDVVEDLPPEVAFSFPGHDAQATAIEEVTLRFSALDDFGVNNLTFNYSLNGGPWVEETLTTDGGEIVLPLEELRIPNPLADEERGLRPGDMISFYAQAKDHSQQARTALYFVDVRPFDRVYRESQSNGGQDGQGGGPLEIAERQREILSATWNLINAREVKAADNDQADVLALLQRTLKDQVTTLIARANARRLTVDDEIDAFTTELTLATDEMEPAAEQLEAKQLQAAIAPEQAALQHLLAAQATMSDVDVSMGRSEGRGTAGRSLSELMDLEMDQKRNRYETPQSPSSGSEAQTQDEEWQRLEELANRQEQLSEQQRSGEESLASRWQQERLQRELEQLREQLQRRQRSQQSQNQQSQQSRQGQQGSEQMQNAIAELNQARQAIDQSLQQPSSDPAATREATEALRRAAQQLRENALGNMGERLAVTDRQVQNLLNDQRNIMDRLNDLQRDALNTDGDEEQRYDDYAMAPYAERKRRMQQSLNEVIREIGAVGGAVDDAETERVLAQAIRELADGRVDERLAASADAFEYGRPLYAISNEATVEQALSRLSGRLDQAQRALAASDPQSQDASPLAQVRTLRQSLTNANGSNVNSVQRAADALEFRLGQELGEGFELDTTPSRQAYNPLGTDHTNSATLVQMTKDRLDLLEATLLDLQAAPIRAQEPRDEERDSEAAAQYFKGLSRQEG